MELYYNRHSPLFEIPVEFSQAIHHSRSGTQVEGSGVQVGGGSLWLRLPEAHLWKGHSLHSISLSVKEEWYCQGSYGNMVECVV